MWNYNYTDELYHYGVLGMKWGVRKSRSTTSKKSSSSGLITRHKQKKLKKARVQAAARARAAKAAKAELPKYKQFSDDELRQAVSRLTLEKQYRELTKPKQTKGKYIAQKFSNKLIDDMVDIANAQAKKAVQNYVESFLDKNKG